MCIEGQYYYNMRKMHVLHGGEWFYQLADQHRRQIIYRLAQLPLVFELQLSHKKIGFLHADIELKDWNVFKQEISKGSATSLYSNALWERGQIRHP